MDHRTVIDGSLLPGRIVPSLQPGDRVEVPARYLPEGNCEARVVLVAPRAGHGGLDVAMLRIGVGEGPVLRGEDQCLYLPTVVLRRLPPI